MNYYIDTDSNDHEARPGKGPIPADYAVVGIAPSTNRPSSRDNEPFGAKSWEILQGIRKALPDQSIYATNLVKTPVQPGTSPKMDLMRKHYPGLIRELQLVKPKRILALGAPVARWLCPDFKDLREDHGTLFYNPLLECLVVPTYHFSAAARNPSLYKLLAVDLERFFELPDPVAKPSRILDDLSVLHWPMKGSRIFLDIETTGFDPEEDEITALGFSFDDKELSDEIFIVPNPTRELLRDILFQCQSRNLCIVGHNLAFDLSFLWKKSGIFWDGDIEDTMVIAYLSGELSLSLKHLASTYTSSPGSRAFGSFDSFDYLAEDVSSTNLIYRHFSPILGDVYIRHLANQLVKDLVGMRSRGVFIDRKLLKSIRDDYQKKQVDLTESLFEILNVNGDDPINLNSDQQLVKAFQDNGVELTERTPKGAYSLAESVLQNLSGAHPEAALTLEYRSVEKTLSTFIDAYLAVTTPSTPYLYPRLFITSTRTGRLSCRDPNLQQVPRLGPIKLIFKSRWENGQVGLIDFSQAELRVFAILSGDETFGQMLMSGDAHRQIASILYRKDAEDITAAERKKSKGVTFGLLFGGTEAGLAFRMGTSIREVKEVFELYFHAFPKATKFIKQVKQEALRELVSYSPFGRRRLLEDLLKAEGTKRVERVAINTPVQGTASDLNLIVLAYISKYLREHNMKSRPFMAVHDSTLLEIWPGEEDQVAEAVQLGFEEILNSPLNQYPMTFEVPFTGELIIGESWAHAESTAESYYNPTVIYPMNSLRKEF